MTQVSSRFRPENLVDGRYEVSPRFQTLIKSHQGPIFISGKTGQGKSVLAAGLYHGLELPRFWLALDAHDNSIESFLPRFIEALGESLPLAVDEGLLTELDLASGDFAQFFDLLAGLILRHYEKAYLFFDDFQLLSADGSTRQALVRLISLLGNSCRVVLIARGRIEELELSSIKNNWLTISDDQLAFTEDEAVKLYEELDEPSFDLSVALTAYNFFGGWPLPIEMLRSKADGDQFQASTDELVTILDRSYELLLRELDPSLVELIARLSIPPTFPVSRISRVDAFPLGDLLVKENNGARSFSPNFRKFLATKRQEILSAEVLQKELENRVDEAISGGRYLETVDLLVQLDDPIRLEEFFNTHGELIPPADWNPVLNYFSSTDIKSYSLLPATASHIGRFYGEQNPSIAEKLLYSAAHSFSERGDVLGEIKAWCYLLELRLSILNQTQLKEPYEALQNLLNLNPPMTEYTQLSVNIQLGGVSVYLFSDSQKAHEYLDKAQILLQSHGQLDDRYIIACYRCIDHIFNRRIEPARRSAEKLSDFFSQELRASVKIAVAGACGNFLALIGQYSSLKHYLTDVRDRLDRTALEKRQQDGFFQIWQAQYSLLAGDERQVISILESGLETDIFLASGDSRRMGCILMAIAQAASGEHELAHYWLSKLDSFSSTPNYRFRQQLSFATAHIYLAEWSLAEELLAEVQSESGEGSFFHTISIGILAYSLHKQGRKKESRRLAVQWAEKSSTHNSPGFLSVGYTFDILLFLIEVGSEHMGQDQSFGQLRNKITKSYLDIRFNDNHEPIPELQFTTAPTHCILFGKTKLTLTRMQRRFLFTLAVAKNQKMTRENLIEEIWPDQDGSDNRLYILVNRLKKKLAEQQCDVTNYLSLQAGEVALFNANIDFVDFRELAGLAEIHEQDQAPWLANALRFTAIKCWEGFFDSDLGNLVPQTKFRAQDVRTYREICAHLAGTTLLSDSDARTLLERLLVLQAQESESLELAKSLVLLYRQIGDVAGIYNTKKKFAEGLRSIDVVAEEAATLLTSLG